MEAVTKVTTTAEILHYIFKMLSLEDQVQLTSVCKEFEYVIDNFIWKLKFKQIHIKEPLDENCIEFFDATQEEYKLMESEHQIFIPIIAKHVEKLKISTSCKDKLTDHFKFDNLKFLEFYYTTMTQNNLKSLAINCPKLETIGFELCSNVNGATFDLNKRGQLEILAQVKGLKHLMINAAIDFDFSQLNEIFKHLRLKSLTLEINIYSDDVEVGPLKNCNVLEQLNIGCFYTAGWLQFKDLYLHNFTNLTSLTLSSVETIFKESCMATLAATCNKLQELTLQRWKILIHQFPKQLRLKKLTLRACFDLTWKNLQQIFAELNLEKFVTEDTIYGGTLEFFYDTCVIANTLQIIDIKTEQNEEFLEFFKYVNNTPEKLKIFRYEYTKHSPFSCLKHFLELCTNLQELYINNVAIPINDLMQLKTLKILKFSIFPSITWSFLQKLFTHPSLANISLEMSKKMERKINNYKKKSDTNDDDDDYDEIFENEDDLADFNLMFLKQNCNKISTNLKNLKTNLQFVKIPFIIFHKHQDLFLDLLNLKKDLKLTFYSYVNPEEMLNQTFLNKLFNNKKFPSHIKYIKILNKYYDCRDLKENFRTTVDDVSDNNGCLILTL